MAAKAEKVKKIAALFALAVAFAGVGRAFAQEDDEPDYPRPTRSSKSSRHSSSSSRRENPLFGFTHLLPSPYTLPAGRLVLGTEMAFGVTDFLQVSTNLLRDFYKIVNVGGRLSVIDFPTFALAFTYSFEHYNLHDVHSSNPNTTITSHQPGVVTSFGLLDDLALFVGGNLNMTNYVVNTSGLQTSGYVRGATIGSDLSWAYSHTKRKFGNVLSPGWTYDVTYKLYGIGLSHHWPGFRLGVHYYPNAKENKMLPLISGGAVVDI